MLRWAKNIFLKNTSARQTVFKNTVWLAGGQIISRVLRAVIIIYAARILGASSYGAFSYTLSLVGFFTIFSDIGLTSLLTREASRNEEESRAYIATSLLLKLLLVLLSVVLVIGIGPLVTKIPEAKTLLPIAALLLAFDSSRDFLFSLIRAKQKMEIEALVTIATNVLMAILAFLVLFIAPGSKALMGAYMISSAVGFLIACITVGKNFYTFGQKIAITKERVRTVLKDAWPFALLGLMSGVMISMDTLMLGWLKNATDVGLYGAAQRPILLFYALPALFATSLFPLLSKYAGVDKARFKNIIELGVTSSFVIVLPLVIGGVILGKELILLLYGKEFIASAPAFITLLFTLPIVFPAFIINDALVAYNKQRTFFFWSAIGVVGNILLNLLLIPPYGIVGAALATVGSQIIVNVVIWYKLKKINNFNILHRLPRILLATVLMAVVTGIGKHFGVHVLINVGISTAVFIFILHLLKEPLVREYKEIVLPNTSPKDTFSQNSIDKKKILLVRANDVAPDVRVEKVAHSLHSLGYVVRVIAWNRTEKVPQKETREFGVIDRIPLPAGYDLGIKLLPKLIRFWITAGKRLWQGEADSIYACDFDTIIPALIVAKVRGKKIIYDIFDFYAEGGNVPNFLRPIIRAIDKLCMHMVDRIIIVDEVRLSCIPKSLRQKTEIIYNTPRDTYHTTKEILQNFPRIPVKQPEIFRIVYSGNLIDNRYIIDMIHSVSKMKNVEYLIAGFGPEAYRKKILDAVNKTTNVYYIGKNASHQESLALESTADLIFALNNVAIANNTMMSANKLFEGMMLGIPVLVNKGTSMDDKVARYKCGIIIDTVTTENITRAISHLQTHKEEGKKLGENGREAFLKNYTWDAMEQKLKKIYSTL